MQAIYERFELHLKASVSEERRKKYRDTIDHYIQCRNEQKK